MIAARLVVGSEVVVGEARRSGERVAGWGKLSEEGKVNGGGSEVEVGRSWRGSLGGKGRGERVFRRCP